MDPQGDDKSHVPAPSLLPVAFAIGVVVLLVGLIINNWIVVAIGAVISVAFGGVWLRDVSTARAAVSTTASTACRKRLTCPENTACRSGGALRSNSAPSPA